MRICSGAALTIYGKLAGSVAIDPGARVSVLGALDGSVQVESGAELTVEEGARLAGSLDNSGRVVVRGVFGGERAGTGQFLLEGKGYVKTPQVTEDGSRIYRW